jgi:protein-disulfide isomerase
MTQILTDGPDKFELVEMKGAASSELSNSDQVPGDQVPGDRAITTEPVEVLEFEPPAIPRAPESGESDSGNVFEAPVTTPATPVSLQFEQARHWWSQLAVVSAPQSLLLGQVTNPPQATPAQATPAQATQQATEAQTNAPEQAKRRTVTILNNLALDVTQWPIMGKPNAEFVVVEMLDYTCIHCQNTHAAVHGAREQLGDRLAVIVLPVPLSASCNQHVRTTHADHAEACELANVAIAVWRVRPEAFEEFHGWLLTTKPRYAQAWGRAAELCGEQPLKKEIDSGVPAAFVAKNVNLYERAQAGALPKILFPSTAAVGEMRSANTLISLIQNHAAR